MNQTFGAGFTEENIETNLNAGLDKILEMCCSPCGVYKKEACNDYSCDGCKAWWDKEYEPQKEIQQWISVEDRLPELHTPVIGWVKLSIFSDYQMVVVERLMHGWSHIANSQFITAITHWMPLPELPKEFDNESSI